MPIPREEASRIQQISERIEKLFQDKIERKLKPVPYTKGEEDYVSVSYKSVDDLPREQGLNFRDTYPNKRVN